MHTKRLAGILVGLLLSFSLNAGQTETGCNGENRLAHEGIPVVTWGTEVAPYQSTWQKPYENGEGADPVPIMTRVEMHMTDIFELTLTQHAKIDAQYNTKRNTEVTVQNGKNMVKLEHYYVFPALAVGFWVGGAVCMMVFFIQTYKRMKLGNNATRHTTAATVAADFAALLTIATTVASLTLVSTRIALVAVVALVATWVALATAKNSGKKGERIWAVVYFAFMLLDAYLFYTM